MRVVKIDGGLGNQLFQYAFYLKTKKLYGECYVDLGWFCNEKKLGWYPYQLERLGLVADEIKRDKYCVRDYYIKNNEISSIEFEKLKKNMSVPVIDLIQEKIPYRYYPYWETANAYYRGWFQNIKYFEDIFDEICNNIRFPQNDSRKTLQMKEEIQSDENSVSLHIRLNDYPQELPHMEGFEEACGPKYYNEAIRRMLDLNPKSTFYVFSNKIDSAKKIFGEKARMVYVDINDRYSGIGDMELISLCKHHIISNSTFGWWSAVLSHTQNNIVIAPDLFDVRPHGFKKADINLYFDNWIRI